MQNPFFKTFGFVSLILGILLIVLHATDINSHLSVTGVLFVVLGLASFVHSLSKKI